MNKTTKLILAPLFGQFASKARVYDVEVDEAWARMLSTRYGIEVTPDDIAEVRGIQPASIRMRQYRAKKRQGVIEK